MYDDAYATCGETYVTLRIYQIHPDEVTARLRLQPDSVLVKGERWKTRAGRSSVPARVNGWFFTSKGRVESRDVRRHLDWLLDQIEPHAGTLGELQASGGKMDVSCYWESLSGHGGPTLSPSTMGRLAVLGLETWFDVYFAAGIEEGSTWPGPGGMKPH